MSRSKLSVLIIVVVGTLLVIISILSTHPKMVPQYGYANILLQVPDTQDMRATINDKVLPITGLHETYKLHSGNQDLEVIKQGFKPFSTNFTVVTGQTVVIDVAMTSNAPQTTAAATKQVAASLAVFLPEGFTVIQSAYFYSNTWVVATVSADGGDTAVLVAKYVGGSNSWQTVLGPGTLFYTSDMAGLPADVSAYIDQQHYVLGGDD